MRYIFNGLYNLHRIKLNSADASTRTLRQDF